MVSSAHQKADNSEAAALARDAEKRVRGGESAHEALQHEAHALRHLESKHGHFKAAHYKHELRLVERQLHKKLEHDGLLPHMHIRGEGADGQHRHPLLAHKDKPMQRTLQAPPDNGQSRSPAEKQTGSPEPRRLGSPGQVDGQLAGDPTVAPPRRLPKPDVPLHEPAVALRLDAQDRNPGEPGDIPNWMGIHNGLVKKANSTAPDLAFYGDSITEGMHLNNSFARGFGGQAENFGIHSDTTDNLRYRLQNGEMKFKDGKQPKDVVMLIGTNDMDMTRKTTAQIAHDVIADAELAAKNLPGSKVLLLGLLPRAGYTAEVKDINSRLEAYMNGPHSANLRYADVGAAMLNNGRMDFGAAKTRNASEIWQVGGKHPTYGPGYSRLFNAINGALRHSDSA